MSTYKLSIHSPSLNITEDVSVHGNDTIVLETSDQATTASVHLAAQYNFLKYKGVSDWQANVVKQD
jgi:hypothetical protein